MNRLRFPAAILFLMLFTIVGSSEPQSVNDFTGKLVGQVMEGDRTGSPSTFIYVHYNQGEESANRFGRIGDVKTRVDATGRFEVRLSPSLYDVFVVSPNHLPDCQAVRINAGKTTEIAVNLKLDLINTDVENIPVTTEDPRLPSNGGKAK